MRRIVGFVRPGVLAVLMLLAMRAMADQPLGSSNAIIPGALIVDARSVMDAARMDRIRGNSGAQSQCIDEALGGPAAQPAGDAPKPNKLSTLVGKVKERAQLAGDGEKRSQVARCTQERRQAFVPQKGLDHYAAMLLAHTTALPGLASAAMGVGIDGAPLPKDKASPTCARSTALRSVEWRAIGAALVPTSDRLPPLDGLEAHVNVIDLDCYRRTFPDRPIPPGTQVLSVHDFLDRVIAHRVARLRAAGYGAYADALTEAYKTAKTGGN